MMFYTYLYMRTICFVYPKIENIVDVIIYFYITVIKSTVAQN